MANVNKESCDKLDGDQNMVGGDFVQGTAWTIEEAQIHRILFQLMF